MKKFTKNTVRFFKGTGSLHTIKVNLKSGNFIYCDGFYYVEYGYGDAVAVLKKNKKGKLKLQNTIGSS